MGHGTVTDAIARAGVGFAGACLAAAAIAWGFRKTLKWAGTLIITAGAFTALFFGLIAIAEQEEPASKPEQTTGK